MFGTGSAWLTYQFAHFSLVIRLSRIRARINFPHTFLLYQRPRSQAAPQVEKETTEKNTSVLEISSLLVSVGVKIIRFWIFSICGNWPLMKPVTIPLSPSKQMSRQASK